MSELSATICSVLRTVRSAKAKSRPASRDRGHILTIFGGDRDRTKQGHHLRQRSYLTLGKKGTPHHHKKNGISNMDNKADRA